VPTVFIRQDLENTTNLTMGWGCFDQSVEPFTFFPNSTSMLKIADAPPKTAIASILCRKLVCNMFATSRITGNFVRHTSIHVASEGTVQFGDDNDY